MKLKRRHDLGTDLRKRRLQKHGYIGEFEYVDDHRSGKIVIELNGRLNKCGVISPRFDVGVKDIEPWTAGKGTITAPRRGIYGPLYIGYIGEAKRIVEVKANERKKALEEILYALVVQKFMDADVSLIPSIAPSSHLSGKVDTWPNEEEKHEELHSQETFWPARRLLPRIDVKALSLFGASKNVFRTMMKTNHEYLT
ncbi:hypothetical protein IFM89_036541 [Coptis chinensis]|uniref:Uncharacterized protein n=1 Tax=Coptis chinensis TaxID=261450 RepID=A0A835IUW3_9MAGN|nr:hypothetical protein IFM89_036541 [Coptis chinensis]